MRLRSEHRIWWIMGDALVHRATSAVSFNAFLCVQAQFAAEVLTPVGVDALQDALMAGYDGAPESLEIHVVSMGIRNGKRNYRNSLMRR
jgi:cytochrome c oxidase assembly factor CtaG